MARNFDISRVNNPYAVVLGLGLVLEGVLGAWIVAADDGTERIASGVIMAVVLLAGILAVTIMQSRRSQEVEQLTVEGLGSFRLTNQTEETAAESREPARPGAAATAAEERVGSSDGTFSIALPPADWRVEEITFAEWVSRPLGITDPAAIQNLTANLGQIGQTTVLAAISPRQVSIVPKPGETLIEGRPFPTALELDIPLQMAILPMDKIVAPLYVEQSVQQQVVHVIAGAMGGGMNQLRRFDTAILSASKRPAVTAEIGQTLSNVTVNGVDVGQADIHWSYIGIEGPFRHYIIVMYYAFVSDSDNGVGISEDLETLRRLAGSFRPLFTASPEAKQAELDKAADESYRQIVEENGETLFANEMQIMRLRLSGMDLDRAEDRTRAIRALRPFKAMAEGVGLSDADQWAPLWESLDNAEGGDARDLKQIVADLVGGQFPYGPAVDAGAPGELAAADGDDAQG